MLALAAMASRERRRDDVINRVRDGFYGRGEVKWMGSSPTGGLESRWFEFKRRQKDRPGSP